jgi:hypothetical protein
MAITHKVLGQVSLGATTLTAIYTVPALKYAVISTVVICNRGGATTIRLSVAVAGAADDPKQYIYYDVPLPANDALAFTAGITLATTDVLKAYAGAATVTVSVFGAEGTV